MFVSESRDARGGDSRLARDRSITLSCIAFSYFLRSEMPLSDELAASMTYLFWFCTFSFHCASHVTVLSCCTTPHAWPGIGQLGTLSPSPTLIVTCGDHAFHSIPFHPIPFHPMTSHSIPFHDMIHSVDRDLGGAARRRQWTSEE